MRLNAYIAKSGLASRRGADDLIKAGKVKVNGKTGELNSRVFGRDIVEVNGQQIKSQKPRYILLYKPERTVTTLKDPEGRPTILVDVVVPERVVPVGRLDFNTTGALLLTNDGELAHRLMHPSFEVDKVYEAVVEGEITSEKLNKLSNGIELEDGKTAPATAKKISQNKLELTIHEGRQHQVKRMLEDVDLPVKRLHRSKYGPLILAGLSTGKWRDLTEEELSYLIKLTKS